MTTTTSTDRPRHLLVDTSAWIAMADAADQFHHRAMEFHRTVQRTRISLTWGIVAESYAFFRYHAGYALAQRWLAEITEREENGSVRVIYPTAAMSPAIQRELARFADQDLSYVDAMTLHIARSFADIHAIFAFDHHMALAGLPVYPL